VNVEYLSLNELIITIVAALGLVLIVFSVMGTITELAKIRAGATLAQVKAEIKAEILQEIMLQPADDLEHVGAGVSLLREVRRDDRT
jgi:hypothetical protein